MAAVRVQKTVRFCCSPLLKSCESLDSSTSSSCGESLGSLDQLDVDDVDWFGGESDDVDAVCDFLSSVENLSVSIYI